MISIVIGYTNRKTQGPPAPNIRGALTMNQQTDPKADPNVVICKISFSLTDEAKRAGVTHAMNWHLDFTDTPRDMLIELAKRSVIIRAQAQARREINSDKNTIGLEDWRNRKVLVKALTLGTRISDPGKKKEKLIKDGGTLSPADLADAIARLQAMMPAQPAAPTA